MAKMGGVEGVELVLEPDDVEMSVVPPEQASVLVAKESSAPKAEVYLFYVNEQNREETNENGQHLTKKTCSM